MRRKLLKWLAQRACTLEQANNVCIASSARHMLFVREYYLYCIGLFRVAFAKVDTPCNVVFGDYAVDFGNPHPTLRIDLQFEHTLVKPGGRDSGDAAPGAVALADGSSRYLVRVVDRARLEALDAVIEYSLPNLVNLRGSGRFDDYLRRAVHIAPLLYTADFSARPRGRAMITLFADAGQPRRAEFLDKAREAGLPLRNVKRVFGHAELQALHDDTRILVNVHQTDHHHTLEELRILPALQRGVIVVSEDVPLKEHVPYSRFIVWSSYGRLVDAVRDVHENYARYHAAIFDSGELASVLAAMRQANVDNVEAAVRRLCG